MEKVVQHQKIKTSTMVKIAILSVIGFMLMYLEFIIPITPAFLKLDLSDIPAIIGGLALGPVAGILIELVKNILKFIFNSNTGGVGEIANFVVGGAFVFVLSAYYQGHKTKKGAVIGSILATIFMTIIAGFANYFVLIPFYSNFMPLEAIIAMGSAVNGLIHDKLTLILFGVVPFNIIKGILIALITGVIYKKISPIIKGKY